MYLREKECSSETHQFLTSSELLFEAMVISSTSILLLVTNVGILPTLHMTKLFEIKNQVVAHPVH